MDIWVYDPLVPGEIEKVNSRVTEEWMGEIIDHQIEWGLNKRGCFYFFMEE